MIRVNTADEAFNRAYCNAMRALPVITLERPSQYGARWREAYRCRVTQGGPGWPIQEYIFDCDEDYTWFMLKWS
jgi:hypothetical protein